MLININTSHPVSPMSAAWRFEGASKAHSVIRMLRESGARCGLAVEEGGGEKDLFMVPFVQTAHQGALGRLPGA